MSAQQSQTKSSTATSNTFTYKANDQDTDTINIETITKNIEKVIAKYKITKKMDPLKIKNILAYNYLESEFEKLMKSDVIIKEDDDNYSFGNFKNAKKEDIINFLLQQNKDIIKRNIEKEYENLMAYFTMNDNIERMKQNRDERILVEENIKQLNSQRDKMVEKLEIKNNEYLKTMFKQSQLESQMRTELSQQQFQQQNVGLKYEKLKQGLENQIIQKEGLMIQNRSQIQTAIQYHTQNKQHIAKLQQQYQAIKLKHEDAKQQAALLQQANNIAFETLNQNIGLRRDLNANLTSMSNLMKANSNAQIQAINQASQAQIQSINQASQANLQGQQQIINATNQASQANLQGQQQIINASKETTQAVQDASRTSAQGQQQIMNAISGTNTQIDALTRSVNNFSQDVNQLTSQVSNVSNNLDKLSKQVPPNSNIPPGCDASKLRGLNCKGNTWNMTPEITDAINIRSGVLNIKIYRCSAGGHFCASDGGYGDWHSQLPPHGYMQP